MTNRGLLIIAAAVVVVLAGGGYFVSRSVVPGGRDVTVDLVVTGDKVSPQPEISAHRGDRITLSITADKKEEIHLHGYDIHFEVASPGDKVTRSFTADKTGDFEYEIEATSTHLGDLKVT